MRPRIVQRDGQIGFYWATPANKPTSLPNLVIDDDEPDRLGANHLVALDDALIIAAGRFGELLYDWLMAHREDPDSAAIQIPKGHQPDAAMIIGAVAASVSARTQFDPGLAAPARSDL